MIFKKMTTKLLEDKQLIKQILAGERPALFVFWQLYAARLLRFVEKRVEETDDAEEILQDSLLAGLDGLRDFQGQSSLFTYLVGIAKHKIVDYYRKKKIKQIVFSRFPGLENLISEILTPEEKLVRQELKTKIKQVLRKLAPEIAELIQLKYEQELTIREIAGILGITIKAAESKLFRARTAFSHIFNEEKNFKDSVFKAKRNCPPADS